jgi:glutamyl-Q tRNA(Asp) synthetase
MLAAVGSYLRARSQQGEWHVRIDDIDQPRVVPGAADSILKTLERYGLHWDGPVVYQSQNIESYEKALLALNEKGVLYHCGCSRSEIAEVAKTGPDGPIYPGTCRDGLPQGRQARSIRIKTSSADIHVNDLVQGRFTLNLAHHVGDFVIRRADGFFAYHLATVIDDAEGDFSEIVRGKDLLSSTPKQIYLQQQLALDTPDYAHLPLLTDEDGKKLGKSTGAQAVDQLPVDVVLSTILKALGVGQKLDIHPDKPHEILSDLIHSWDLSTVPSVNSVA